MHATARFRPLPLLLLLLCLPARAGTLIIAGGALKDDNAAVWQRLVDLAGGHGAAIAVFPSASATPERSGEATARILRQYGAEPFVVPAAVRWRDIDYRAVVRDAAWIARVRQAGGVFFTGGDQGRITAALAPAGQRTPMLEAIDAVYRQGGVIGGTSAGAAVMSQTMFYEPPAEVLPVLQRPLREGSTLAPGLGFLGPDVFVDQHLLARGRLPRMLAAMHSRGIGQGLGVDENTAVLVRDNREAEVLGAGGVIHADLRAARADARLGAFNLAGARLSYLERGDRVDLATRRVTVAPARAQARIPGGEPAAPVFRLDALAPNAVPALVRDLMTGGARTATALAYGGPGDAGPGFEFRFSRTPESAAFADGESFSALYWRLDIRPVRFAVPLYRPYRVRRTLPALPRP